jgi:hypothetical protein
MSNGATVQLGPGPLGASPFALSGNGWHAVQSYVAQIVALPPDQISLLSGLIDGFGDLESACQTWQDTTFPQIVALAQAVEAYGAQTVPTAYRKLDSLLATGDQSALTVLDGLGTDADRLASAAGALVGPVQTLADATAHVQASLQQQMAPQVTARADVANPWAPVIAKLAALLSSVAAVLGSLQASPLGVVQKIQGAWTAIAADLAVTHDWVAKQIQPGQPFLADLAIQAAIDDWASTAAEAGAFVHDAPTPPSAIAT